MIDYYKLTNEQMVEMVNKARPGDAKIFFNNIRSVLEDRATTRFYIDHQDTVKQMFLDKIKVDQELDEAKKKLFDLRKKYYTLTKKLKHKEKES